MRILCFGDSNTYGYDPRGFLADRYEARDRWVDLLAAQTGHEMINAGSNGREIPWNACLSYKQEAVDILLIMLGTNDLLQGATAKEAAARMESFFIFPSSPVQSDSAGCTATHEARSLGTNRGAGNRVYKSCRRIPAAGKETECSLCRHPSLAH